MEDKLKQLIEVSQRLLITSHISPDPDAVSSLLLLGGTLKQNFPAKDIRLVLEEEPPRDLSFLAGYGDITFADLADSIEAQQPELIIIVDANSFSRCSRLNSEKARKLSEDSGAKVCIIDHHEEAGADKADVFINNKAPATAQEVYRVCFDDLGLSKPAGYADIALLGIISDTYRFKYANPLHRQTFAIVSDLLDSGASIEKLENTLERYQSDQMTAFSNLAANLKDSGKGYSYSYLDDQLAERLLGEKERVPAVKSACEVFTNQFIRNFENNQWGFIVYPEVTPRGLTYSVSFRAVSGVKDVAAIAAKLGGGGHKEAAGAKKLPASSAQEAIAVVEKSISETL